MNRYNVSRHIKKARNRQGAAVIAVVIFVTVIGLAGAIYFLSNRRSETRQTTYTIQRKEATNCMESGIQIALQCIQENTFKNPPIDPRSVCSHEVKWEKLEESPQSCLYDYSLEQITSELEFTLLKKDHTDLVIVDPSAANGTTQLTIQWETETSNALEFNSYTLDSAGTRYDFEQTLYLCNMLSNPPADSSESGKAFVVASAAGTQCSTTISLPDDEEFLQVTSRYGDATNISVLIDGPNPPLQGYKIASTGKAGDAELTAIVSFFINEEFGVARMINNSIILNGIL